MVVLKRICLDREAKFRETKYLGVFATRHPAEYRLEGKIAKKSENVAHFSPLLTSGDCEQIYSQAKN